MNWIPLHSEADLQGIVDASATSPQVIFKHSTRCSISSMAKARLERSETPDGIAFHYLDLIANRSLSNLIAEKFDVWHESPQVLIIKDGKCVFDESHNAISMDEIVEQSK